MGQTISPKPPVPLTPFGSSGSNVVTAAKPTPILPNPGMPAYSGYSTVQANGADAGTGTPVGLNFGGPGQGDQPDGGTPRLLGYPAKFSTPFFGSLSV